MISKVAALAALGLALGLGGAGFANAAPVTMNLYKSFMDNDANDITVSGDPFETTSVSAIDFESHDMTTDSPLWPTPDVFFAAIFTGDLTTSSPVQTFRLSSDDASYLYIDGTYIGGLPGQHAVETVVLTTMLTAGTHTFRLAYDNTAYSDAVIHFDPVGATFTSTVPLPATLPMFGLALLGLSAVGYGVKRGARTTEA